MPILDFELNLDDPEKRWDKADRERAQTVEDRTLHNCAILMGDHSEQSEEEKTKSE